MASRSIVTTCTRDCPNTCGLIATVEDGRLVRLRGDPDHPLTAGAACHKCFRYIERVYSPERVTHPLRRVDGRWRRATWDEALDLVADKLRDVAAESGPEAILHYQGYGERTALKLLNRYFFNLLGGVTTLRGSLCGGAGQGAQDLDFGTRVSHDPLDHYNSASMILWARNPVSTNISLVRIARDIRNRGGTVVVIDPARTRSVSIADHHIRPRPGRDGCLAMAASKLILRDGAEDRAFLEARCDGFAGYEAILDRFSVEELCSLAGVSVDDARLVADVMARQRPASILLGWGLHRHEQAHLSIRPIDALAAISGNLGVPGGGVSQGFEEYGPYDQRWWGDSLNPERRTFFAGRVGEAMLSADDPPVRAVFVTAANPVCSAPNTDRVAEAFRRAEMVVYSGHFLDDTAELADIFLPATTFLEETDVVAAYGHNYVGPVNRVIEPVGEARSEFRMFHDLAARFPFADAFRRSEEEWLVALCAPLWAQGADPAALRRGAFRQDKPMVPYADGVFPTGTGRFRFMDRFDPALLDGEGRGYPYTLLTIAPHGFICSERTLAEHDPLPTVRLNTAEAIRCDARDGQAVWVRSERGRIMARLRVGENMRNDVAVAERGGWNRAGHGLNRLTRDMESAVGGGTPFYSTRVAVEPCAENGVVGSRVLVVGHSDDSPGGLFTRELERRGCVLVGIRPDKGDPLPDSPRGFDRLVVLGGPQRAFDDAASPHFSDLMRLMRDFDAAGLPVAGICLGAQLLARAHGGGCRPLPGGLEFGFTPLSLTPEGEADPIFRGAGPVPPLMQYHEDAVDLPATGTLLARGGTCANQCFRVGGRSYGFQFHLEVESVTLARWLDEFERGTAGPYAGHRSRFPDGFFARVRAESALLLNDSAAFCAAVVRNWLRPEGAPIPPG